MNLNGQVYQASRPATDGSSLTISRTSRKVDRKPYLVPGYPAPLFQAQTAAGKTFDLRRECAKSQYVLVEFWADWCPPCRRMYEDLSEINRKYKNRGLKIVGINRDHDLKRAATAISENGLSYDHIFDNIDDSPGIGKKYRVKAIPRTYLLDSTMQIVAFNLRGEALKEKLEQLLADPN
jgi:thiol-disulfide isomerase/thioredoxin